MEMNRYSYLAAVAAVLDFSRTTQPDASRSTAYLFSKFSYSFSVPTFVDLPDETLIKIADVLEEVSVLQLYHHS